jgi:glycosyltransferase involved in cell wall biosynthesis
MSEQPFVSVVIPVFNDIARLRECLTALEEQTYAGDRYEVVVVDNASRVQVRDELAPFPHAIGEYEARKGSYSARNRGLTVARGEVLAFTDADCLPASDWIEEGVAALEARPECGLVAGQVRVVAKLPEAPTLVEQYELVFGFPQPRYVSLGFGATANMFTRRAVIERVGPFSTDLESGGDREWGLRVKASGYEVCYAVAARVDHPARRTMGELIKKTVRTNRGMYELTRRQGQGAEYSVRLALADLKPPVGWISRLLRAEKPAGLHAKLSTITVLLFNRWLRAAIWLSLEAGRLRRRADAGG